MRKAMIVGVMALAGYGAGGGQGAETTGYQVTVYMRISRLRTRFSSSVRRPLQRACSPGSACAFDGNSALHGRPGAAKHLQTRKS